ncbi:MAG TPA: DUF4870 domain-containing protein [Flavobacterium sp.]|nr:DUF4870 domain-containing protein [Flavobacterium sp.]HPJ11086.1 DUF4870 domain-containing protein [Flavobacterium sp.]
METNNKNNTAAFINLSTLTQYFIPFGNFIFPIIIWTTNKDKSGFVDRQGKDTINFQLSLFLYSLLLALIAIPTLLIGLFKDANFSAIINHDDLVFDNFSMGAHTGLLTFGIIAVALFGFIKVAEFFLIIHASIKTSNGDAYKYPLTIPFIK